MILATEDILSEAVARKLVTSIRPDITISVGMGNRGKSYLQDKARDLNRTAGSRVVFLLADLDNSALCPIEEIRSWVGGAPNPRLFFRFAISEIESWVLADRDAFSRYLGIPLNKIPNNTDIIAKPKEFVITLARGSRARSLKSDLVPRSGGTAKIGPAYNSRMISFVSETWDPTRASAASDSLGRALRRLQTLSPNEIT